MNSLVFNLRRKSFAKKLGADGIAFIPGARAKKRNDDVEYPFRQESNMLYLTGFNEPDALLVILGGDARSVLFSRPKDKREEIWTGKRLGQEGARTVLGIDDAYSNEHKSSITNIISELLRHRTTVYYPINPEDDSGFILIEPLIRAHQKESMHRVLCLDVYKLLAEMRLIKDPEEIRIMREGIKRSALMHREILEKVRPGMNERELEAEILYHLGKNGSDPLGAYPPIVAAGKNACILHYTENSCVIGKDDLVLVDAGGEFEGYASDITRTFPAKGSFSPAQREVYAIVLAAQKAAINMVRPGMRFYEIDRAAKLSLCEGLIRLGFIAAQSPESAFEKRLYEPFTIHSTSHWLGLDVHDAGDYLRDADRRAQRMLEPGMVLTVEPGLYFDEALSMTSPYRDMGIRIEDDVLVTNGDPEVLSIDAPKEIQEIEDVMQGSPFW